jgi:8-oxo-dGTP pyrophosphatase MutT (NUDIX family)
MWDLTVGGSAISGDTSQMAAQRELSEELGLDIDFTGVRPHLTIPFEIGFDDYYLVEQEVDLTTLTLQEEEVQRVAWMTEEAIVNGIKEGWFIGYHESLIRLLFALRHSYGAHNET